MNKVQILCRRPDCKHIYYKRLGECLNINPTVIGECGCESYTKRISDSPKSKPKRLAKWPTTEIVKGFKPKDIDAERYKLIEGFRGTMVINKVSCRFGMFSLVKPIVQKNVSVYAIYDKEFKRYEGFCTSAQDGWHLPERLPDWEGIGYGDDYEDFNVICTGELKYDKEMSRPKARNTCVEIAKQLEVITVSSATDNPSGNYEELDNILTDISNKDAIEDIENFSDYLKPLL